MPTLPKARPTAAATTAAHPRLTDFPAYIEASARLNELSQRHAHAAGQADQLELEFHQRQERRMTIIATAAEKLRLARLREEAAVLAEQVAIAKRAVEHAKAGADREVLKTVGPRYRELLNQHVKDILAAARSADGMAGLRSELEAAGVTVPAELAFAAFRRLGSADDYHSSLNDWLHELIGQGLLTGTEDFLPAAVRPK